MGGFGPQEAQPLPHYGQGAETPERQLWPPPLGAEAPRADKISRAAHETSDSTSYSPARAALPSLGPRNVANQLQEWERGAAAYLEPASLFEPADERTSIAGLVGSTRSAAP